MNPSKPDLPEEDPLRQLSTKALRRLARQYRIKHFYRKSPSHLRRAIRRAQNIAAKAKSASSLSDPIFPEEIKPEFLNPRQQVEERRQNELKAYEEHRLRYLMMPSLFVHKGTHEEYLLEKEEELNLPEFYLENELTALPIDPHRFYVYWDFDEETLYDVRSWLAESYLFSLRIHDVSGLVFDGANAHRSWSEPCQPLVREWYINTPISDAHLLIELGVHLQSGFHSVLRSNPLYIPPETVSPVILDRFVEFVPTAPLLPEKPEILSEPAEIMPPQPESSAHTFFQTYVATPEQFAPLPPARHILKRWEAELPIQEGPPPFNPIRTAPRWELQPADPPLNTGEMGHAPKRATPLKEQHEVLFQEPAFGSQTEREPALWHHLRTGGKKAVQEWLGTPHEIRWLSDLPIGSSPLFFEQWMSDPYDRAVMISYSIWPWQLTEFLPLGASDQNLRQFLGASLFSWYRPGGSERIVRWTQNAGPSEQVRWIRPLGASEQSWSGSLQTDQKPRQNSWSLWPIPASGQGIHG